jgi:hypothetical protein
MHKLVKQHVVWIWIALLGVLFSALAPTISHAMAAADPDQEVQVCTMEGMKTFIVDHVPSGQTDPRKFDPHKFDHLLAHCPYCALHGGPAAVPPPAQFVFAVLDIAAAYPPLFYQSATPLFAWRTASPRGPPSLT